MVNFRNILGPSIRFLLICKFRNIQSSDLTDVCVSRTCPACVSGAVAWVGRLQPVLHHGQQLFNLTAYTSCEAGRELGIERIYKPEEQETFTIHPVIYGGMGDLLCLESRTGPVSSRVHYSPGKGF